MSTASKHENIIFRKSSENLQVSMLDIEYNTRVMDAIGYLPRHSAAGGRGERSRGQYQMS
jgi:hypothetical protein